jgi:hypothetical protein
VVSVTNSYCTIQYGNSNSQYTSPFIISSTADWNTFCDKVKEAAGNSDINAVLTADITVTQAVGGSGYRYRGTFDGNGHTINMNISVDKEFFGLFANANGYTIKNLRLTGKIVTSAGWIGGLVGDSYSLNNGTNYILNCRVSASIKGNSRASGFIAYTNLLDKLYIKDCLFDGSVEATNGAYSICYGNTSACDNAQIYNFLEHGKYSGNSQSIIGDGNSNTFNCKTGNKTNNWGYQNWYDVCNVVGSMSARDLVNALDCSNWQVVDGQAVPVMSDPTNVSGKSADQIVALLGSGWTKDANGQVAPKTADNKQVDRPNSAKFPYNIHSTADWDAFCQLVAEAKSQKDIYAQLLADITVTKVAGYNSAEA